MANHVTARTFSLKITQPSMAAKNGAVANNSIAFATDVFWIAKIPPEEAAYQSDLDICQGVDRRYRHAQLQDIKT